MARGGFEVSIDWENGTLKKGKTNFKTGQPSNDSSYKVKVTELKSTEKGKAYIFAGDLSEEADT